MKLEGIEIFNETSVNDLNDENEKQIIEEANRSVSIEPREKTNCEKMKNHRYHKLIYFITLLLILGIVLAICGAVGLFNQNRKCKKKSTMNKLTNSNNAEEMLMEKETVSNSRTNSKQDVAVNDFATREPPVETPTTDSAFCLSPYSGENSFLSILQGVFQTNKTTSILLGINLMLNAIIYRAFTTRKFDEIMSATGFTPLNIVLAGLIVFSSTNWLNFYYTRENKSKRSIAYMSSWVGLTAGSAALMYLIYWLTLNYTGLNDLKFFTSKAILIGLILMSGVSYTAVNAATLTKLNAFFRRPRLSQFLYLLFAPIATFIFGYMAFASFFKYGDDIVTCATNHSFDQVLQKSLYDIGIKTFDDYGDFCANIMSNTGHFWRKGTFPEHDILYSFWKALVQGIPMRSLNGILG